MEGDTIIMQEIFAFRQIGVDADGRAYGEFIATGIRPTFMDRLETIRLPPLARPVPPARPAEGLSPTTGHPTGRLRSDSGMVRGVRMNNATCSRC